MLAAAVEVDKAIFFSVIITIAAFLPLFTMQGVEGQIFGPMARTYAYALIGAVIATFTVTPVLASFLLPEKVQEIETFLVRGIRRRLSDAPAARRAQCADRRRLIALAFLIVVRRAGRPARHRVPAEARRGQSVDSRGDAADHHARGRHGHRRRASARRSGASRRCRPSPPSRAAATTRTDPDGSFLAEFFVPLKPRERMAEGH